MFLFRNLFNVTLLLKWLYKLQPFSYSFIHFYRPECISVIIIEALLITQEGD
jgi:hypothetical protein